eukprot:gene4937-6020_t
MESCGVEAAPPSHLLMTSSSSTPFSQAPSSATCPIQTGAEGVVDPAWMVQVDAPEALPRAAATALTQARTRLLRGFRKSFHDNWTDGALSPEGLRVLIAAGDRQIDQGGPLCMWDRIERHLSTTNVWLRWLAKCILCFQRLPLGHKLVRFVSSENTRSRLLSIEVASEYYQDRGVLRLARRRRVTLKGKNTNEGSRKTEHVEVLENASELPSADFELTEFTN